MYTKRKKKDIFSEWAIYQLLNLVMIFSFFIFFSFLYSLLSFNLFFIFNSLDMLNSTFWGFIFGLRCVPLRFLYLRALFPFHLTFFFVFFPLISPFFLSLPSSAAIFDCPMFNFQVRNHAVWAWTGLHYQSVINAVYRYNEGMNDHSIFFSKTLISSLHL